MSARRRGEPSAEPWEEEFRKTFNEGRFRQACAIFAEAGRFSAPVDLMLDVAAAHLTFDPAISLRVLSTLKVPASQSHEQVRRHALLAGSYARTEDFDSADYHFETALRIAGPLQDADLIAQIGYGIVSRHLFEENPETARAALEVARRGTSLKSRAHAILAEILVLDAEERFAEQAARLIDYLELMDPQVWPPPWPEYIPDRAYATANLAYLTGELYLPDALPHIERQLGGIPWHDDYLGQRFVTLKNLALAAGQQGDYFTAFRFMKRASAAVTKDWEVTAACDLADLARWFGERGWFRVELDNAEGLAAQRDWSSPSMEDREALLTLAELFAEIDPARSSMYLAQYRKVADLKLPLQRRASRHLAYMQKVTGVVELAMGNRTRGLDALRAARATFERTGFDFRVAECLIAEYRASGDRELLPSIDARLRHYPQSHLAREIAEQSKSQKRLLSPMQQTVFEHLCQGKSTAEIARAIERSEYTVSNHIKEIFKTFEVRSRAALLAKAASQGLVGPP